MRWNIGRVDAVWSKQQEAVKMAAKSEGNRYGLSIKDVKYVVVSSRPQMEGGEALFIGKAHSNLWEKLESMSIEDIVKDYLEQITHPRILEACAIGEYDYLH
jgi:hypothetical protein